MLHFARRTNWDLSKNAYTRALEEHRRSGRELLDLTASNPTTVGLHYDGERILGALTNPNSLTYEPAPQGLFSAREAIATYYAEKGMTVPPENLVLTTSTSEAYGFLFRLLCNAGDSVLVPAPSYPLFDFLADLQDVTLIPYELVYDHGWQMDFHSLSIAQKKAGPSCRAVLVVHPNNPTGSFVQAAEAAQLRDFCVTYELAIIADEVFLDYGFLPISPDSFAESHEEGSPLTFTLSGVSKISGLPQMKVAWIAISGPTEVRAEAIARLEVIADTYLSMNAPLQWAVPQLLDERRSIQPQLSARVAANLQEIDEQLSGQRLCERLRLDGGWYTLLRVPDRGSDEELAIALLQGTGVLVQPGNFYNFAQNGHLVLSLITPTAAFRAGVQRILDFIAGL